VPDQSQKLEVGELFSTVKSKDGADRMTKKEKEERKGPISDVAS